MNHERHLGIYQVPTYFNVGIVGAGGLGATTALALAKMGVVQMTIWDDDVISDVNIPTQLHRVSDVGKPKVDGLAQTLSEFSDEIIVSPFQERIDWESTLIDSYNLFIAAVDSIEARKQIWNAVINGQVDWFLDLRMASEQYQHFLVPLHDMESVERYGAMLNSLTDENVIDTACTEKATFHTSMAAAGHAGAVLRNILREVAEPHRLIHYIVDEEIVKLHL
jgi:molybdopterin/thiamine biosynthesis adenylyltransferase